MQDTAGTPTLNVVRERLQHLGAVEDIESSNAPEFTRWADVRLDRWLVDWCLRNGKEKTARMIAAQKGIEVHCTLAATPWVMLIKLALCRNLWISTSSPTSDA